MAGEFTGYGDRQGQKMGGIHAADPDGGRYKLQKNGETDVFLIKRDTQKGQNDIAEYLAASIFQKTAPGYGAEVELAKNTSATPDNPGNKNAFLVSKYFKQYKDFFQDRSLFKERGKLLSGLEATPIKSPKDKLAEKNKDGSYKYTGYEQSLVTSLLVGDFSVHSGNMGVIGKDGDPQKKLVRIDFGAAFRDFSPDINPYKSVKNRIGQEKNYFLRDHPKERIVSKEFSDELRRVGSQDLNALVAEKWADIEKNFDDKTIKAFGAQLGLGKSATPEEIKGHLAKTFHKRQQSLVDMANEIDISLAMKIKDPVARANKLQEAVDKAVKESPDHCQYILDNPKKSQLKIKYSKEVLGLLKETLASEKTKTINPLSPPAKSHDAIVLADKLQPKAIVLADPIKQAIKTPVSSQIDSPTSKLQSGAIDPMTLIRQEVTNKQNEILKNAAASIHPEIDKLSPKEFQEYLAKPGNKQKVEQALEHPVVKKDLEQEIQKAEVAGYKKFNEEFAKVAKPVAWDSPSSKASEKLQVVKNGAGEEICTLTEKTVKLSKTTTLPDGTTQQQEVSARTIEFPPSIKEGSGPMHASFALKDEHGENMPAKDAVYFTAHYDKSGKLTEVSSPQPVKFMGSNPETAVGYIERDGQIYTLPVTQKNYENMMQQTTSLSKQEDLAKDIAVIDHPVKAKPVALPSVSPKALPKIMLTGPESTHAGQIDKILKDRTPKEVVEILKDQVKKGKEDVVDLIVKATDPKRPEQVPANGVPKLTAMDYKEAYDYGMHHAAPAATSLPLQKFMHTACAKLKTPAHVPSQYHQNLVTFNTKQFGKGAHNH